MSRVRPDSPRIQIVTESSREGHELRLLRADQRLPSEPSATTGPLVKRDAKQTPAGSHPGADRRLIARSVTVYRGDQVKLKPRSSERLRRSPATRQEESTRIVSRSTVMHAAE
jgi:hypothetical protein